MSPAIVAVRGDVEPPSAVCLQATQASPDDVLRPPRRCGIGHLQRPFDFSKARPNPYLRFAARAKGRFFEVTDEEDAKRNAPGPRSKRAARKA